MVARLGNDLGGDTADAGAGQADGAGGTRREVKDASLDEGTAVVDGDDDALAAMGHPQLGSERQRAVGAGHGVLVEALAGSGLAAGFIAVERGYAAKLCPPEEPIEALASRQSEPVDLLTGCEWWRWCLDLAEASVTLPPTRRVAAIRANAVRDRVTDPGPSLLVFNIN